MSSEKPSADEIIDGKANKAPTNVSWTFTWDENAEQILLYLDGNDDRSNILMDYENISQIKG